MDFPLQLQTFRLCHDSVSLFVPDSEVVKQRYQSGAISFPYWSKVWPAAIGLGEFMLRNPIHVQGKRVLELGAGLGLPSLVAARYAASVLCTDLVPEAVEIAARSAIQNQIKNFEATAIDWQQLAGIPEADVLLMSDVNYEPGAFAALRKLIDRFFNRGASVILSTPQRLMAKDFISPLLDFCSLREEVSVEQNGAPIPVTVMVLNRAERSATP